MKQLLLLIAFLAFCMPALAQEKETVKPLKELEVSLFPFLALTQEKETVKPLKELEVTLDTYDCQGERCFSILTYAFGHGPLPVGTEAKIEGETYETDIREAKKGTPLTIKLPNLSKELVGKKVKVKISFFF